MKYKRSNLDATVGDSVIAQTSRNLFEQGVVLSLDEQDGTGTMTVANTDATIRIEQIIIKEAFAEADLLVEP